MKRYKISKLLLSTAGVTAITLGCTNIKTANTLTVKEDGSYDGKDNSPIFKSSHNVNKNWSAHSKVPPLNLPSNTKSNLQNNPDWQSNTCNSARNLGSYTLELKEEIKNELIKEIKNELKEEIKNTNKELTESKVTPIITSKTNSNPTFRPLKFATNCVLGLPNFLKSAAYKQ